MDKIEAILDAACILFGERGFENTTVAEIARKAGVASGTVIYHFGKKEAVLFYLAWKFLNTLYRETLVASEAAPDGRSALRDCVLRFFELLRDDPHQFRFLLRNIPDGVNLGPLSTEDLKALHMSYIALLESAIERGVRDGSLRDARPHEAAMILSTMLLGSARLGLHFEADIDRLRDETLAFLRVRFLPGETGPSGS